MNKLKLTCFSLLAMLLISSCTKDGAPTSIVFNADKTAISVDNNVKPRLSGSACSYSIWPWATIGDSSVNSAKDDAGISKVATLDASHLSVFTWSPVGWFVRTCSVVTGE